MTELTDTPIEITALRFLEARIRDVPVFLEKPERPPRRYILIRKTGSSRANRIMEATLAVQSIAPSLYDAMSLSGRVVAAMDDMGPGDGVFTAHLNSDYEYTDLTTKEYRYQAIFEVYY